MSGRQNKFSTRTYPANVLNFLRSLRDDQSGATYTLVGVTFSVLLGMAGLGFDGTTWYMNKRELQTVADVSALAGLEAMLNNADDKGVILAASDHALRNNFVDGDDGELIVNVPPKFGEFAGRANHVEVITKQEARQSFSSFFIDGAFDISARSVAGLITVGGNCVLALSPDLDSAIQVGGTAVANINCGVASNSTSESSLRIHGGGVMKADPVQVSGDINIGNNGTLSSQDEAATYAPEVADPYAGTAVPKVTAADCDETAYVPEPNETMSPGVYCDGLVIDTTVDLEPGVYIIYNGDLSITDQAVLTGDGVTFVFTGSAPANIGGLRNINGQATVDLTAPDKDGHAEGDYPGEFAGLLLFQDYAAIGDTPNMINGGSQISLKGGLYFPKEELRINGNSAVDDGCMEIVANKVTFLGTTDIENDDAVCKELGVDTTKQLRARLRE